MPQTRTQILATVGPSSKDSELIKELILAGTDLIRLNFSYGDEAEHLDFITRIRQIAQDLDKTVPIVADLSGPRQTSEGSHQFDKNATSVLTEKDKADVEFVIKSKVDYIAMSYVGDKSDIEELKNLIQKNNGQVPVISKIERQVAVDNIDEIIEVSDAIMIARGDLGNEVALEKIPFIETMVLQKCKRAGKPVITATQLLYTMKDNPKPTRAEVTDIVFAVMNGTDVCMLSDETAVGKYPVESVKVMKKIIDETVLHIALHNINKL